MTPTPDGLIYHTGAGHYDLVSKIHVWYLRDRMGSTVAVVGADGALLQTTGYYPSGTPYRLPSATIQTPVDRPHAKYNYNLHGAKSTGVEKIFSNGRRMTISGD